MDIWWCTNTFGRAVYNVLDRINNRSLKKIRIIREYVLSRVRTKRVLLYIHTYKLTEGTSRSSNRRHPYDSHPSQEQIQVTNKYYNKLRKHIYKYSTSQYSVCQLVHDFVKSSDSLEVNQTSHNQEIPSPMKHSYQD